MLFSRSAGSNRGRPSVTLPRICVVIVTMAAWVLMGQSRGTSGQESSGTLPRSAFLRTSEASGTPLRWYKGNTHTHTMNADGDSTPEEVVRWYREHNGYHFVVLTDHDFLTSVDALNALHGAAGKFLVMAGEEITDRLDKAPIHLNGINHQRMIPPQGGTSVADVLQRNIDAIRGAQGIPTINHPNYKWAIGATDILKTRNVRLLEVFSTNPDVNTLAGGGKPGVEELWDELLSAGLEIYAVAADDAHTFKQPWNPDVKRPGLGWVVVRSTVLTPAAIASALDRGEFYASTGIVLDSIVVTAQRLTIAVKPKSWEAGRIQFIGRGGRLLKEVVSSPADYEFAGDEHYVRARVIDSNGRQAWVQPVFLTPPSPSNRTR
jgi:hypothetical protein